MFEFSFFFVFSVFGVCVCPYLTIILILIINCKKKKMCGILLDLITALYLYRTLLSL